MLWRCPVRKRNAVRPSGGIHLRGYLFILPVVLGLLIWTFGPMIASAYYSLTDYKIISEPQFVGLKNFVNLFTNDKDFVNSLSVTIRYGLMYVGLAQVVSLGIAVLLTQKVRGMTIFRTIFYLPMIVPYVASALLWKYIYNKEFGPIDSVLKALGLPAINWLGSNQSALFALVIMSVWSGAVTTIIYVAGLQNIPEELLDSAKIDGANARAAFLPHHHPHAHPDDFLQRRDRHHRRVPVFCPGLHHDDGRPSEIDLFLQLQPLR